MAKVAEHSWTEWDGPSCHDKAPTADDACVMSEMMQAVQKATVDLGLDDDDLKLMRMDGSDNSEELTAMAKRWRRSVSAVKMRKARVFFLVRRELCRKFGRKEIEAFFRG